MAILTLVFGRDELGTFEVESDKLIIGRAEDCEITIDNLAVSRHHSIIEKKEGVFTVNDLDSNNGTFVNGQRITEPTTLNFGDEIGVGKHVLVFDSHSKKGQPAAQAQAPGGAMPDMDSPGRGTMFVEPDKMEQMQQKVVTARKAHLQEKSAPGGRLIPIEQSDVVFGKGGDSDIRIEGFFASFRHAILSRLDKGYQLTNLAVFSPTKVNGSKVDSAFLVDGDEIKMGKSVFIFHSEQ